MAPKPIRMTAHARFQMRRRSIRAAEVEAVVRHPDQVVPSSKGRRIMQSKIGSTGRLLLRVIVKEDLQAYHVITVYKTSRLARYWKP